MATSWLEYLKKKNKFNGIFFNLFFLWKVVKSLREAKSAGFSDVLFLDAATGRNIEEVSTCNIFVVKVNIICYINKILNH